jgi:hypothetical protein
MPSLTHRKRMGQAAPSGNVIFPATCLVPFLYPGPVAPGIANAPVHSIPGVNDPGYIRRNEPLRHPAVRSFPAPATLHRDQPSQHRLPPRPPRTRAVFVFAWEPP